MNIPRSFYPLPETSAHHINKMRSFITDMSEYFVTGFEKLTLCSSGGIHFLYKNRSPVAQLIEHRVVTREVVSSTPAGPTLRVLKITEEKVLPL